jgi:hypothetical protein
MHSLLKLRFIYTSSPFKVALNFRFQARGKIVLFNYWVNTKNYDKEGYLANKYLILMAGFEAEKYGAVGVLVRASTDFSLYSPHVGHVRPEKLAGIPAASLAVEDAELIDRISKEGKRGFYYSKSRLPIRITRRIPIKSVFSFRAKPGYCYKYET